MEQLELQTVALVRFVDDEGDTVEIGKGRMVPFCSAVWIDNDKILTAQHCVAHAGEPAEQRELEQVLPPEIRKALGMVPWDPVGQEVSYAIRSDVEDSEHQQYREAVVLRADPLHDLALLYAPKAPHHPTAHLSQDRIHDGDPVHIVGHTVGMWWTYMTGVVSATRPDTEGPNDKKFKALQISAPAYFGNSGGGAFDQEGRLVGITSFIRNAPNMVFFVHRDEIVVFLTTPPTVFAVSPPTAP